MEIPGYIDVRSYALVCEQVTFLRVRASQEYRYMRRLMLALLLLAACCGAARLQTIIPLPGGTVVTVLKLDSAGNIYVGGSFRPASPRSQFDLTDAFVAKLSSDGSQTFFRTVLAGVSADQVNDIVVGADGSIYATGTTSSNDFPSTASGLQPALGSSGANAFYVHVDAKGAIAYATFRGGDAATVGLGIAADTSGAVYITGRDSGTNIGAFVSKVDAAGRLAFHTAVTGGNHVALDAAGNIFVAGTVVPPSLVPVTTGAFQTKAPLPNCPNSSRDLPCNHQYVSKLDPTGKQLLYSTFVAGGREEGPMAFAVDAQGNAYLAGSTTSTDYPVTAGAYQAQFLAGPLPQPVVAVPQSTPDPATGYVSKLNPTGSSLIFSTYLGGSVGDSISSLALDAADNVYLAGAAYSEDFPGLAGVPDRCTSGGFVTRLSADGSSLSETQLTYGVPASSTAALALDPAGKPWIGQGGTLARVDLFAPSYRFACATDAADFALLGQVVPGQLIALFGVNIGLGQPAAANPPSNGSFPPALKGVSVTFNGVAAPALYVSPSQVNVQVPFELAGQATAHMEITMPLSFTSTVETRDFGVVDRAPSVFVLESGVLRCGTQTVVGQHPAALNADGTGNSCGNPAVRGSTVTVFFQSVGVTSPAQSTGAVSGPAAQALNLQLSNTDGTARFVSVGSVPGTISGVWAAQLQIPNGFTTTFSVAGVPLRDSSLIIWSK